MAHIIPITDANDPPLLTWEKLAPHQRTERDLALIHV